MNEETRNELQETEAIEGIEGGGTGTWEEYPIDELAIRDERRAAVDVVRRLAAGRFRLDPDFQRDFVWDRDKQSRLIESVLMRIPLPVFYVAEDSDGALAVVDGRQRLTTLKRFFDNELLLQLPGRSDLHHKRFSDLEPRLQNRLEDCQLHFYIIDRNVPERARLDIFERVNGGEVLTRQQMRNAIYSGVATRFLKSEAKSEIFKKATGDSLNTKKMLDREFVNRYCSFELLPLESYKGDMDDWLASALILINKMSDFEEVEQLSKKLELGLKNNFAVFGRHAFRKHRHPHQSRSVLNASLFDVMMKEMSIRDYDTVISKVEVLRQAFFSLMDDQTFMASITYGPNSPKAVRARFEIARHLFEEVFDAD